jgi:predicted NAD/FAD-dependent oxidoreductase
VSAEPGGRLPEAFRVAVVGAGISGLTCAGTLKARGARVVVFESARRPGGRAATETTPAGRFDCGAQYFTAQSADFERHVAQWLQDGLVAPWSAQVIAIEGERTVDKTASARRYIVRDGMQALGRRLAADLDVRLGVSIASVTKHGNAWQLFDARGESVTQGGFDAIVLAVPQPRELLASAPELSRRSSHIVWQPCWAVLLALQPASGFEFGGAFVNDHPALAWITREDSKLTVSSGMGERWVLHATPRWSALHLNHSSEDVASALADAFAKRFNFGFRPAFMAARRWVSATPANPLKQPYLWDPVQRLGAVGDWCGGPRLEGAFVSGRTLGQSISA